jgi:hypothetical protein
VLQAVADWTAVGGERRRGSADRQRAGGRGSRPWQVLNPLRHVLETVVPNRVPHEIPRSSEFEPWFEICFRIVCRSCS